MKYIKLTQNKRAIVDNEDFERLNQYKWYFGEGYAAREVQTGIGRKSRQTIRMHRVVTNCPKDKEVDHSSHNKLDNRKTNLRICTRLENGKNKKRSIRNTSGFKGVYYRKSTGKWEVKIRYNWKLYNLGVFDNPNLAALAYNRAAIKMFGNFAYINKGIKV